MCKNNDYLISDEQKILQTTSLQDYVKRLWNHSNTKIPVTIGKGTDTAKPRSKAPHAGQQSRRRLAPSQWETSLLCNAISHWEPCDIWSQNLESHKLLRLGCICTCRFEFWHATQQPCCGDAPPNFKAIWKLQKSLWYFARSCDEMSHLILNQLPSTL